MPMRQEYTTEKEARIKVRKPASITDLKKRKTTLTAPVVSVFDTVTFLTLLRNSKKYFSASSNIIGLPEWHLNNFAAHL